MGVNNSKKQGNMQAEINREKYFQDEEGSS